MNNKTKEEQNREVHKSMLYGLLLLPILYIKTWLHEIGHAIVILLVGGDIIKIGVDFQGGYVEAININIEYLWIVGLIGGVVSMLYFIVLANRIHIGLYISAFFSLIYGLLEMVWVYDTPDSLFYLMNVSVGVLGFSTMLVLVYNVREKILLMKKKEEINK